jgi:hypothetical protein
VRLLLESGADISARTAGDLPFTTARLSGHNQICDLIRAYPKKGNDAYSQKHNSHMQALADSIEKSQAKIDENCNTDT